MFAYHHRYSETEHSQQCKGIKESMNSNKKCGDKTIKDRGVSVINTYEEISDIPRPSKPIPAFSASTGNITLSPISLKHSSLPCISNLQQIHVCNELFHLHESSEKSSSNQNFPQADHSAYEGTYTDNYSCMCIPFVR